MPEPPVVTTLRAILLTGTTEDGRLPTERQLSEMLSIGRPAVREQLHALESVGLVRRDQGRGTFIQPLSGGNLGNLLDLALAAQHVAPDDLMVVRLALEREAARLAAGRIDATTAHHLAELCERMRDTSLSDDGVGADHEFHYVILSSCGNSALRFFADTLSVALHRSLIDRRRAIRSDRRAQLEMARAHDLILEALLSGNSRKAASSMDAHFRTYERLATRVDRRAATRSSDAAGVPKGGT